MSRIKTLISGALVMIGLAGAARANDDLLLVFAGCAGRLSAEMEHAWLMNDGRAEALKVQREHFVTFFQAIMPEDRAREALRHRFKAKLAHSAILTTARFGTDPRRSRLARQRAHVQVQSCQTLLLDG